MTDNELLLAIGDLMDKKLKSELQAELQPIKDEISSIKEEMTSLHSQIDLLKNEQAKTNLINENEIIPGIQLLKENYVPAAKKYIQESVRIEAMQADIEVMKSVIREHSEKLQKIS